MLNIILDPYKSFVAEDDEGKSLVVSEGDMVQFVVESTGEIAGGTITKIVGKGEKLKLQTIPLDGDKECEELWPVWAMVEGSLKLID